MSRRLRTALIGAGFIGPWHVDAVRRLGNVDVVAVATGTQASADAAAQALYIPAAYGDYRMLLEREQVDVVHVATPNHLHHPVALAAIQAGKHVICDKPLATTIADAHALLQAAEQAGVFHAVTFNYRGNALIQQARQMVANGDIGAPHFIHGRYLQDWLLLDTDWSWRQQPDKGGASSALGDIGTHWCDLAEHVSGARIVQVLAELETVVKRRQRPHSGHGSGTFGANHGDTGDDWVDIQAEDLATVLLRFDSGARGVVSVGQVCAGHKNDLALEINGQRSSLAWRQEAQNTLWVGHRERASELLPKDPGLLLDPARPYARLPGGHQEAWADAFTNLMRDLYGCIAHWPARRTHLPPTVATFADGVRSAELVQAMLDSATQGGRWTDVPAPAR